MPKFRSPRSGINDGGSFKKHVERMLAFRKSHIIFQPAITSDRTEEPTPPVSTVVNETGTSRGLPKAQEWQLWIKDDKAARHQFSAN